MSTARPMPVYARSWGGIGSRRDFHLSMTSWTTTISANTPISHFTRPGAVARSPSSARMMGPNAVVSSRKSLIPDFWRISGFVGFNPSQRPLSVAPHVTLEYRRIGAAQKRSRISLVNLGGTVAEGQAKMTDLVILSLAHCNRVIGVIIHESQS